MKKSKSIPTIITIVLIVCIFFNIDFEQLVQTFKLLDTKIFLILVPIYLLTMFIRGYRWKCLIPKHKNLSVKKLSELYITGATLNILLPARAGDFFRAWFAGKKYNRNKLEIFASVIAERMFDGLSVVSILIISMLLYKKTPIIMELSAFGALIFGGSLVFVYLLLKLNKTDQLCNIIKKCLFLMRKENQENICSLIDKINKQINHFIVGFNQLLSLKSLTQTIICSAAIWLIECYMTYLLIYAFGFKLGFSASLFAVCFIALATIIPSTSIYVGPYQYAFILALGMYGISKSSALAIAFTQQTLTLLSMLLFSIVFLIENKISFSEIKKHSTQ